MSFLAHLGRLPAAPLRLNAGRRRLLSSSAPPSRAAAAAAQLSRLARELRADPALVLMNCGAALSLSAFLMHDVLHLRALSMAGGACGITYNFTRAPRQTTAVAWGVIFFAVNAVQVHIPSCRWPRVLCLILMRAWWGMMRRAGAEIPKVSVRPRSKQCTGGRL